MNRSERRAASRKTKGGSGMTFAKVSDPYRSPVLDYAVKVGEESHKEKVLRSKQVPGY
jgi:hypothetical protein